MGAVGGGARRGGRLALCGAVRTPRAPHRASVHIARAAAPPPAQPAPGPRPHARAAPRAAAAPHGADCAAASAAAAPAAAGCVRPVRHAAASALAATRRIAASAVDCTIWGRFRGGLWVGTGGGEPRSTGGRGRAQWGSGGAAAHAAHLPRPTPRARATSPAAAGCPAHPSPRPIARAGGRCAALHARVGWGASPAPSQHLCYTPGRAGARASPARPGPPMLPPAARQGLAAAGAAPGVAAARQQPSHDVADDVAAAARLPAEPRARSGRRLAAGRRLGRPRHGPHAGRGAARREAAAALGVADGQVGRAAVLLVLSPGVRGRRAGGTSAGRGLMGRGRDGPGVRATVDQSARRPASPAPRSTWRRAWGSSPR
jgi:hypothetical protein